jgi:penicillin-binding protein 1C
MLGVPCVRAMIAEDVSRALDPMLGGPLRVVDRDGRLLRSVPSPHRPGREQWVRLGEVNALAIATLLASEDQRFFSHPGVDAVAIARAAWLDLKAGRAKYGASTVTMQLARMVYPDIDHSWWGKLRQIEVALRIEHRLPKLQILEQYLNRAYFGRGAYGIEAASRLYFGKPAQSLSDAEAILLLTVPRAPSAYDLVAKLPRALQRRDHLLRQLVKQGRLTGHEAARIRHQPLDIVPQNQPFGAGHFVDWVVRETSSADRERGGTLVTTLDSSLQGTLERRVEEHVVSFNDRRASQAGVLVLDTQSGEILAMVGSRDYESERQGQVNIATWRRYPGSALKPFVYAAAIERGASPASVAYDVYDVPSRYRIAGVAPVEYGPTRYREALAGSYNLAAVHVLEEVGVAPIMGLLQRAGVGELEGSPEDYGLRLALGSTKVRLLDLASSYGAFVREGLVSPAQGRLAIERADGSTWRPWLAPATRALSPEVAWLVMDMLADPDARRPRFGWDLPFDLPYRVAAKTGTARGFSDTFAIIATRELTVAAWTGRFDGQAMEGLSGIRGAAALARAALLTAARGRTLTLPEKPDGVVQTDLCPLSGKKLGPYCPHQKRDYALSGELPDELCTWHAADGLVHYPPELQGWANRQAKVAQTSRP